MFKFISWLCVFVCVMASPAHAAMAAGNEIPLCGSQPCVEVDVTVVSGKGLPDPAAVEQVETLDDWLRFEGASLKRIAYPAIRRLAATARALPSHQRLTVQVAADAGLAPAEAERQLKARIQALTRSLTNAGAPPHAFEIQPNSQ